MPDAGYPVKQPREGLNMGSRCGLLSEHPQPCEGLNVGSRCRLSSEHPQPREGLNVGRRDADYHQNIHNPVGVERG